MRLNHLTVDVKRWVNGNLLQFENEVLRGVVIVFVRGKASGLNFGVNYFPTP